MKIFVTFIVISCVVFGCRSWDNLPDNDKQKIIKTAIKIGMGIAQVLIIEGEPIKRYSARDITSNEEYLVYDNYELVFRNGILKSIIERR